MFLIEENNHLAKFLSFNIPTQKVIFVSKLKHQAKKFINFLVNSYEII